MYLIKNQAVLLFWTLIIVIKGEQWYSATVIEESHGHPRTPYRTNSIQNGDQKFMLMNVAQYRNVTEKDRLQFMNNVNLHRQQSSLKISEEKKNTSNTSDLKVTAETNPEKIQFTGRKTPLSSSAQVFKYNNTITNINVIKTFRPKRKVLRRCPTRPRQKKQLSQKAKTRFLEVFEVVEFDHVICTSSSGLEGTCLPESECQTSGGATMGTCADGYGTCCVTQFSCDDHSAAPVGWFTNPGFPSPSTERLSCAVTLTKVTEDVKQIRLDFTNFELLPPTVGTCEADQFVVSGQNINNIIPILCGVNTGQHVYIEVSDIEGPIILSVQTVSTDNRLFSIKVTQLTPADELAPSGCLQYFKGSQGNLESFNYRDKSDIAIARSPSYMNNLNYAMCIERAPESCSITYTNAGYLQVVNYDTDGLPVIPPGQAGVEIFNCPTDWLLIAATRLCGDRLNDGSVLQDFALDAPVTDSNAGPLVVWFRSDGGYVGRGFKLQYQQNNC